ncbi:MAG TPA: DUF502 domain-containing protein [Bacteroidia bacterium]|nr:DUF502 domain-containing protein [Bacteroidia bacterium]
MKKDNLTQKDNSKIYRSLFQFFLQGLLILAPITITGLLLYWLFEKIDGILLPLVNIRGLGFIIIIGFVILVGWISSNFLMSGLLRFFDYWLERTPGVKFIYTSVKDFFGAFTGDKKKFDKAVLVNVFSEDVWIIGFLTDEELEKFEFGNEYVSVYVPQSYNFAGQLYILPRTKIKKIRNISSGEAMKYSVTGGVVELADDKNV